MPYKKIFRKKDLGLLLDQVSKYGSDGESHGLSKQLGVRDLTAFGIAAIIGAGIFSTIGTASSEGGPAVVFLFLFTALACGFSAFAYAEFASMVPVSGSAYTYSYVAFGEIVAWLIGWSLIMEYAIGNIAVAISWSEHLTTLLGLLKIPFLGIENGIHLPGWMTMDFLTARNYFDEASALMAAGTPFEAIQDVVREGYLAWTNAPQLFGFHFVADIPALLIIVIITRLVYRGIHESRKASNAMVVIKLSIVLLIIAVGVFYVDSENWSPFAPNGLSGILKGVSAVFFAYIGFDAISTTAEECKDPQRDLPRGMMWAIIICTLLYIAIALVLTGMVKYDQLAVADPLAYVFERVNLRWISGIIAVSAVVAMASVLLVFQLGQPRIWMSMSRDGLLPKKFSRIHPKFKTPSFATIVTGFVVAIPALFMNLTAVTDLCSIGTLFAFVLVCAGVLQLDKSEHAVNRKFRTPYMNAKWIVPGMFLLAVILPFMINPKAAGDFVGSRALKDPTEMAAGLGPQEKFIVLQEAIRFDRIDPAQHGNPDVVKVYLENLPHREYIRFAENLALPDTFKYSSGWDVFKHNIPLWIFFVCFAGIAVWSFRQNLSIIPVLGLLSCLYMMSTMGLSNWIGFGIWLGVGIVIYATYGYKHSKLRNQHHAHE